MSRTEKKETLQRFCHGEDRRPYYILSLLQERELLRARVQAESALSGDFYSSAASTMAAALIEELLDGLEESK